MLRKQLFFSFSGGMQSSLSLRQMSLFPAPTCLPSNDTGIKLASFNCLCSSSSNGVITSLFMCAKGNLESEVGEFNEEEQTFEAQTVCCPTFA
ncbi:transcription termination factor 1, mitochondrial isoform X4 [Kogia breviceps]|uniref:transcription termination factor 1, mitochondrial isoform X4 n=1 Tax=Kogia breviceps TaxID=27615 RepID=UPI0034D34FC9